MRRAWRDAAMSAGALAFIRYAKMHGTKHRPWLTALAEVTAGPKGRELLIFSSRLESQKRAKNSGPEKLLNEINAVP